MSSSTVIQKSPGKDKKKEKQISYEEKCSKLEIKLIYNGRNECVFIDNKKNISSITEAVFNIFYPIQGKIQLIYKNKDISPFEDIPLFKYFKNLMKITITIKPIIQTKLLNNNSNFSNSFLSSLHDVTAIDRNDASLGNVNQSQMSNGGNILIEKDRMLCSNCKAKMICYFCRICNLFICKECSEKYSSPHREHSLITVHSSNIEKSAKAYKDLINKEILKTSKSFDNYISEKEKKTVERKDIDEWLSEIGGKIDLLAETIQENEEQNKNNNVNLNEEENKYTESLEQLQKLNFDKINNSQTYFTSMYHIDKSIQEISNNLDKCQINIEKSQSNDKILKDLDSQLDNIINRLVKDLENKEKTSNPDTSISVNKNNSSI